MEPAAEYAEFARRNVRNFKNVEILQCGVGVNERKAFLAGELMGKRTNEISGEPVKIVDLWLLLAEIKSRLGQIGLVKLDCEGCEREVLRNIDSRAIKYVDAMAVEFHGDLHLEDELMKLLVKNGLYPLWKGSPFFVRHN